MVNRTTTHYDYVQLKESKKGWSNSLDTVYSSHEIEHLENPFETLEEMKRVAIKRIVTVVPDGDVSSKNFGSPHLHIFNRRNVLELHKKLDMTLINCLGIQDEYMNQIVVVYEKI